MRYLLSIMAIVTSLFAWGSTPPTQPNMKVLSYISKGAYNNSLTVMCIEGYKYIQVDVSRGTGITQMFEIGKITNGKKTSLPLQCN